MTPSDLEVVIVNDYASLTGGSTSVALASARGLAARGVRVTLFTCVGPVARDLLGVPNLAVVCLGQAEIAKDPNRFRALVAGWRNGRAVRELRSLLSDKSPRRTLVHVHTWSKSLSPFAISAAADLGFRPIITLHDFFITCPTGGFFVHGQDEVCRRMPLSSACWRCNCDRRNYAHKLWRGVRTTVQNRFLQVPRRASFYIGVSQFSLKILQPFLPSEVPSRVVRNPVDATRRPAAAAARNSAFVFVGRLEAEKGALLFARAVRTTGLPAVFVGDGALMGLLRQICPRARFTGWLSAADTGCELRGARALVFPPLWYETLGLVTIEAAAAGVPAIVADGCAATDYIRDGINGVHFTHGSEGALCERMLKLAGNDGLVERLGRTAYDGYWADPWTTERHVDALLDVYSEAVRVP